VTPPLPLVLGAAAVLVAVAHALRAARHDLSAPVACLAGAAWLADGQQVTGAAAALGLLALGLSTLASGRGARVGAGRPELLAGAVTAVALGAAGPALVSARVGVDVPAWQAGAAAPLVLLALVLAAVAAERPGPRGLRQLHYRTVPVGGPGRRVAPRDVEDEPTRRGAAGGVSAGEGG
jgi:hypothetical protein